jgi:7-carboxy-7-deazaguanine synthase
MKVFEIFNSIDGEVNRWGQGRVSTFVRLAGCNLRCSYCDTKKTWKTSAGQEIGWRDVGRLVLDAGVDKVTITGGEPLLQWDDGLRELVSFLDKYGKRVSIETNGTIQPDFNFLGRVCFVVDWKFGRKNDPEIFLALGEGDFIKFVIEKRAQFLRAVRVQENLVSMGCTASFAYSPIQRPPLERKLRKNDSTASGRVFLGVDAGTLAGWMIEYRVSGLLNLQLHKMIWPSWARGEGEKIFSVVNK